MLNIFLVGFASLVRVVYNSLKLFFVGGKIEEAFEKWVERLDSFQCYLYFCEEWRWQSEACCLRVMIGHCQNPETIQRLPVWV